MQFVYVYLIIRQIPPHLWIRSADVVYMSVSTGNLQSRPHFKLQSSSLAMGSIPHPILFTHFCNSHALPSAGFVSYIPYYDTIIVSYIFETWEAIIITLTFLPMTFLCMKFTTTYVWIAHKERRSTCVNMLAESWIFAITKIYGVNRIALPRKRRPVVLYL